MNQEIFTESFFNEIFQWYPVVLRILLILIISFILWKVIVGVSKHLAAVPRTSTNGGGKVSKQRKTLATLLRSVLGVTLFSVAVTLILGELGVQIGPILAAAGVVGIAIGFGAQSLITDFLNGFLMLLEGQIKVGDYIQAADKEGEVEEIALRTLTVRDLSGNVHIIPHGQVSTITNLTKSYSRVNVAIGVAYREDIDHVMDVLRDLAQEIKNDPAMESLILDTPEVLGIDEFADSSINLRVRFKTVPGEQWNVARYFRLMVKRRFDKDNIEIPFPHRTVYWGVDKDGKAPPLQHWEIREDEGRETE